MKVESSSLVAVELETATTSVEALKRQESEARANREKAQVAAEAAAREHDLICQMLKLKSDHISQIKALLAEPRVPPSTPSQVPTVARARTSASMAKVAEAILRDEGRIVATAELYAKLVAANVLFEGSQPMRNLQSVLSRAANIRFVRTHSGRGWGLSDRPYDSERTQILGSGAAFPQSLESHQ